MKSIPHYSVLIPLTQCMGIAMLLYYLRDDAAAVSILITAVTVFVCAFADIRYFSAIKAINDRKINDEKERLMRQALLEQEKLMKELDADVREYEKIRESILTELNRAKVLLDESNGEKMEEDIRNSDVLCGKTVKYSENPFLNAVLSNKMRACSEKNIKLECEEELPENSSLSGSEICALFSNILDNAVNSVSELPEEERVISLKARIRGGFLIIKCSNSVSREDAVNTGRIGKIYDDRQHDRGEKSRMNDLHGWGLSIIHLIAEHHDGRVEMVCADGIFTITVWLADE